MRLSVEAPARLPAHPQPVPPYPGLPSQLRSWCFSPRRELPACPFPTVWLTSVALVLGLSVAVLVPGGCSAARHYPAPAADAGDARGACGAIMGEQGLVDPARTTLLYPLPSVPVVAGWVSCCFLQAPPTCSILWPFPSPRPIAKPLPATQLHLQRQNKRQIPSQGPAFIWGPVPM